MSEPIVTTPNVIDQTTNNENNHLKRPAASPEDQDDREAKVMKLDQENKEAESSTEEVTKEQKDKKEEQEEPKEKDEKSEKAAVNSNIINLAQGAHPPPPGLHLLTDPQQQQLLQSYVQAQGQDLANFTSATLAQAMVAPIAVPNLASNLLHQLQQGGSIITALPGPPPQIPHPATNITTNEDGQGSNKRTKNLTNDERRQRRLLRNRVAAKECRKKKKQHIQDMEEKIVKLEEENAKLLKEVEELKAKLSLGSLHGSENYRLMKEVEELNAKLSMGGPLPTGGVFTAAVMAVQQQQQQQQQQNSTQLKPISPNEDVKVKEQDTPSCAVEASAENNNDEE